MPKTPESGGIPLPHTWPPFTRSTWDARSLSLLSSLGRMGHENEGYVEIPPKLFLEERDSKKKEKGDDEEGEEEVPPTQLLHTYSQRRAFVIKSMDLHRHTIGGGRSGRRGRAECVAFLRTVLDKLDEMREAAWEAAVGQDGQVAGNEWGEGEVLSSSDEEEEGEDEEESEEEEEEAEPEKEEVEAPPVARASPKSEPKTEAAPHTKTPNNTNSSKKVQMRTVILNEADFFDQHNDLCEVCNLPGELLCCATCNLVFHTVCARPKLTEEPDDDWKCAYCVAEGVLGGKKDGRERKKAREACKEMEKMRQELKDQKEKGKTADDGEKKVEESSEGKSPAEESSEGKPAAEESSEEKPSAEDKGEDSQRKDDEAEEKVETEADKEQTDKVEEQKVKEKVESAEAETSPPKAAKVAEAKVPHSEDSAKVKAASRSSTPCRELEELTSVPKHLQVDEHEVLYSITGRIQRNRKKPTIYDPKTGPDSVWKSEEKASPNATKTSGNTGVADTTTTPTPKKRGPKPGKKKKKKKAKKPLKKPVKKKILPDTEGVGVLNRLPGALFDCSVCLDIGKIKLCCYCACRICFNKFGKEQTILCDKCDQEYHTFCLTPPLKKLPEADEPWVCPACVDDEKKKKAAEARKVAAAAKKEEEDRKKAELDAKKVILLEKRKAAAEAKKAAAAEARKKAGEEKVRLEASQPEVEAPPSPPRKKSPGRPRIHPLPASVTSPFNDATGTDQQPKKRGRGRPRKDGRDPIPRQVPVVPEPIPLDLDDTNVERSRSGRKIHRTIFHDETAAGRSRSLDSANHAKRPKKGSPSDTSAGFGTSEPVELTQPTSFSSSGFLERSAAAAAKSALASKAGPRRKPGARECMQMSRKWGANVIEQKYFDILMDYSKRGKVDHLIRMRERMDDHARFLETQLAGLEALAQERGEGGAEVARAHQDDDTAIV